MSPGCHKLHKAPYIDRVQLNNLIIKTSSKQPSFSTLNTLATKRLGTPKKQKSPINTADKGNEHVRIKV